ncbi:MAG: helical backbone metal receptor [Burkholderiales bacterium]
MNISTTPLLDAAGKRHVGAEATARIVCLVPSITELLCDLGLARQLVGRSGFCIHPRDSVKNIPKVGGTKSVNLEKIRALAPTHVVVNVDENKKEDVAAIAAFVPHVVVTHPIYARDNLQLYRLMGGIFSREKEMEYLCRQFEQTLSELEHQAKTWDRQKVLYLIWKSPWMTVARATYISHMLALIGWDTLPQQTTERYPEVGPDADWVKEAEIVLLSSEPYRFRDQHLADVRLAFPHCKVALIDGEMTSWYGSRAIKALDYLKKFRQTFST